MLPTCALAQFAPQKSLGTAAPP